MGLPNGSSWSYKNFSLRVGLWASCCFALGNTIRFKESGLQKDLSSKDYSGLMMDELEDLHMIRLKALENIEKNKMRVARYYNKKVKVKQFAEGDLVWKALLRSGLSTVHSTNGP
jgi:hypothetical protein